MVLLANSYDTASFKNIWPGEWVKISNGLEFEQPQQQYDIYDVIIGMMSTISNPNLTVLPYNIVGCPHPRLYVHLDVRGYCLVFFVLHNNQQTSSWSITLMVVVGHANRRTSGQLSFEGMQLDSPAEQQQQEAGSNH